MANFKISDLTDRSPLVAGDLIEIERPGTPAVSGRVDIGTPFVAKENTANKGIAGGYASLDGTGKVPAAQLPAAGDVVGPASVTAGNPTLFNGTTGKLIKEATFAAFKTLLVLVKGDVGLGSVDNTSDAGKPVSTAQATADNLRITDPGGANDDVLQRKAGGWINRTIAQLKTDLGLAGSNTGDQTITLTGDVTGSGTISFAATIAAAAVTLAKMANMATASLIYRRTAGTGVPEVNTLAQLKTDLVLVKADVGLGNLDNTSDVNKPVSTAQQTALDLKANKGANSDITSLSALASINGGPLAGFRNKIINGDFNIWQRATSAAASGFVADDRWSNLYIGSATTWSRQTHTLGQTSVPGNPRYFSRAVVVTSAGAGNYAVKCQTIEGVETFAGKTVTITFSAKADASKNIGVELYQYFGVGGSPSASVSTPLGLKALTTSWQKFSFTASVPSITGKTLGTAGDGLTLCLWLDAGATNATRASSVGQQSGTFEFSRVSIVEGDATPETDPFSPRHIGQEMALCQRYFQKMPKWFGSWWAGSTTSATVSGPLPVPMRASPTGTLKAGGSAAVDPGVAFKDVSAVALTCGPEGGYADLTTAAVAAAQRPCMWTVNGDEWLDAEM